MCTPDATKAKLFDTIVEARDYWTTKSGDLRPEASMPLTFWTLLVEPLAEARARPVDLAVTAVEPELAVTAVELDRCSPEIGYHSTPHRGCILR